MIHPFPPSTHPLAPSHTNRVGLCQGKFPDFLMEAWDDYDFRKKSDNDRPGWQVSQLAFECRR